MRLITGKVRSGKTAYIIQEIRDAVNSGVGKKLLLVPEQYTHEAERELCEACGDSLSLHAEVMSFTGFARWSMGMHGGAADVHMDNGGKLLCLSQALRELQPVLRIYGRMAENPELLAMILQEIETFHAAGSSALQLRQLSGELEGELREKILEIALIMETYEMQVAHAGATAEEPLSILARQIESGLVTEFDHIYVDGFIDFTGLEQNVLKAIMRRKTDLTVCLPVETEVGRREYLLPSELAMQTLKTTAEELDLPVSVVEIRERSREGELRYFADHMFDYAAPQFPERDNSIRLIKAENPRQECEAVAAEILRAVQNDGCRWRDIAVAIRGFEDYRGTLENTFARYGIPLFVSRRDALMEKPLPIWIDAAYEVVLGNWDVDDVTAWLRCGFSGLSVAQCDELCRYLYKWQIHLRDWLRPEPWKQHPDGYGKQWDDDSRIRLEAINQARFMIAGPLLNFRDRTRDAATAKEHAEALAALLRECRITTRLSDRIRDLEQAGKLEQRAEYLQLWEICTTAIRQIDAILGDMTMDIATFRALLRTVLSQYDIGMIPVALDRVSAGDFNRMRRRSIQRLFVLGCTDDRLPQPPTRAGLFTTEERDILSEHDLMVGGGDVELWREYATIYHTLSLPHEKLVLCAPETGFKGEKCARAMVYHMAERIFAITPEKTNWRQDRLLAADPALTLAAAARRPDAGEEEAAAQAWYRAHQSERLEALMEAAERKREMLSSRAVEALYGKRIHISPSRIETFSACQYEFYCNYGLKAEKEEPAEFSAPEIGTFIHSVLENTVRDVRERGGFTQVSDEQLRGIAESWIQDYIEREFGGFEEKSPRFEFLFRRVCDDVYRIIEDTAEELRSSDFAPLSFELDISQLGKEFGEENELLLTGIADRVDGWINDDRLYLRVVDYKTGKKKFSLSDVWYGKNMQMLLYLFAVCDNAERLYGLKGIPAGVLYLPAREELLQFDAKPDDLDEEKQRRKNKRRSGILLEDREMLEAWEKGESKKYTPQKTTVSNPLVTALQMRLLREHVEDKLNAMATELKRGSISVNPSYVSESDNACRLCPYRSLCRFEEGQNGDSSRVLPKIRESTVWENMQGEQ